MVQQKWREEGGMEWQCVAHTGRPRKVEGGVVLQCANLFHHALPLPSSFHCYNSSMAGMGGGGKAEYGGI